MFLGSSIWLAPVGDSLNVSGTSLATSWTYGPWFPVQGFPRLSADFSAVFKSGTAITSIDMAIQACDGAPTEAKARNLICSASGSTATANTTANVTASSAGGWAVQLQTTEHAGYVFVRQGYKINGGPGASGDMLKGGIWEGTP